MMAFLMGSDLYARGAFERLPGDKIYSGVYANYTVRHKQPRTDT